MSKPTTFRLRPYQRDDAPQVVTLVNAATARVRGGRGAAIDASGHAYLAGWYIPVTSERVVVVGEQDQVVAFAYFVTETPYIVSTVGGAVHPDQQGQGVGTLLLEWVEARATDIAQHAPPDVRTILEINVFENEPAAIALVSERGFIQVRTWLHLAVELYAPPPQSSLSKPFVVRPMDLAHDWGIVGPALDDAFADHWGAIAPEDAARATDAALPAAESTQDKSYSNTPGLCFIVLDDDTVAGGILCNGKLVERADSGRVGSLFVRPRYQRQGIGRALMLAAFGEFWQRGLRRIITDTDSDSFTQAPRLYTGLGMQRYRREFLYEKEIRPGREARRLTV